jgi:hypothetical protein
MANIPGINYNIRQALNRLSLQAGIYNEEFVERLLLGMGHPDYFPSTSFGIVTPDDPTSATPGSTEPLVVSVNATSTQTFDVNPGMAVTRSGMWLKVPDFVRQLELDDPGDGVINVVYLQYVLELGEPELNDYLKEIIPTRLRPGTTGTVQGADAYIGVDTLDAFIGYGQDVLDDMVPLALVTLQSTQDPITTVTTQVLSIDLTRGSYTWNRPWFSYVDTEHRAQLGSGIPTAGNPHGTSQNDLTVGSFSPLQLQLDHGMIVADDRSIEKIPGSRCQVSFPYSSVLKDDSSGTKTSVPDADYLELPNYPVKLGRVWLDASGEDWAAEIVEGTNRIVFSSESVPTGADVSCYYTKVDACEPPVGNNEILFDTNNASDQELIIAGGQGYEQLSNTQENFADAQQFPMIYDILVDNDGNLIKAPQVVYCRKRLEAIGASDTFDISLYGPARIICGLIDAATPASPSLSVKVHLYGKDAAGSSIDHVFEFDNTWTAPGPIPNDTFTAGAFEVSGVDNLFAELDEIVIDERSNDGPNSAIMLWAAINPIATYDKLKDACHIARLMWDGLRMADIKDTRIIATTAQDFLTKDISNDALSYIANSFGSHAQTVYMEDLRHPQYHNQIPNWLADNDVRKVLPANNMSKLYVGHNGTYNSRALPVNAGSDTHWRVIMVPLKERRTNFYVEYQKPPILHFYQAASWQSVIMTPDGGLFNTFETTLIGVPSMVRIEIDAADYTGFVVFG